MKNFINMKKSCLAVLVLVGSCLLSFPLLAAQSSIELKTLPAAAQNALSNVLNKQKVKSLQPLKGGLSPSVIYKVRTDKKSYVLRLIDEHRSCSDRDREITCMKIASQRGIAPKVYYANAKEGVIIMEFIQSVPLSEKERSPPILLRRLAHILRKIHHGHLIPPTDSAQEKIRDLVSLIALKKIKLPDWVNEVLVHLQQIEQPLQKTMELAPCHNDLNPNNILFMGTEIKIIDWEAAGMGDPYFDLAAIALFFTFTPQDEEVLLTSYFQSSPTSKQRDRMYLMKQVALCLYGLGVLEVSLSEQKVLLSSNEISALPSFSAFLKAIAVGHAKLDSPRSLQRFAFTALKKALSNMKTIKFSKSLKNMGA